jgi:hypothetical protein
MRSEEAMWINFQTPEPIAIMVGAGSINAINGKNFETKLEKDNYMVSPPQPWLDGWKGDDGSVYQFIATEVGENITVGEQLAQTKEHAIVISVFEAKNPEKLKSVNRPSEYYGTAEYGVCCYAANCCSFKSQENSARNLTNEMGLGKGGKISQKIYEDPHGLEEWKEKPVETIRVYLINASEFSEITGEQLSMPVKSEEYNGVWFGLDDEKKKDVSGTTIFDKLKSAIKGII